MYTEISDQDSQQRLILAYLKSGEKLTGLKALQLFGCFRLSARIYDLKQSGHVVESRMITERGKKCSEYYIASTEG